MAGSFGYDKNTYDISMKMANEKLFPAINKNKGETTIIADGTSCRCQIKDGLNREADSFSQVSRSKYNLLKTI